MTYALIDNATLTAVQRLGGQALTKSNDSVDMDIIALENLVQAILFYDRIIAIDDYIPQYRDARLASFPNIQFLDKTTYNLNEIERTADYQASEVKPKLHGGSFANTEFKNLIELLQTHIVCTWDINSSVYHLTLKSLSDNQKDFEKYGNIAAAIFSELGDATESGNRVNGDVELLDHRGNPISKGYKVPRAKWGDGTSTGEASGAIKAFVAALVWLTNRSIFYTLTSRYLQADTFLYPVRQAYQQNYLSQNCNYGHNYAKHIVAHFSQSMTEDLIDIQTPGKPTAIATFLPMFSASLANQTNDPAAIVDAAYHIRDNSEFIEAREQLGEVRKLFDETDIGTTNKKAHKLMRDIDKASVDMRRKYSIETSQGKPVTKFVQIYNTYAALNALPAAPSYDFKIKTPDFLRNLKQPRGFSAVYRNLSDDLSTVWSLGRARDILGSKVRKDEHSPAYNPKQEEPKYQHSHSPFKSPM